MKELKIIKKEIKETNHFYDERRASNGGGYSQPITSTTFTYGDNEYFLEHYDESCGDFGRRWSVSIDVKEEGEYKKVFFYDLDEVGTDFENIVINDEYIDIIKELSESEELRSYFPRDDFDVIQKRIYEKERRQEEE